MKKIIYLTILMMIVLSSVALASVGLKQETLHYMGIKINIDGKEIIPMDVNKKVVNPFIIDGTTFLPVRAFSEALGKDVRWDGDTSCIYITNSNEKKEFNNNPTESTAYVADVVRTISYEDVKIYIENTLLDPKDVNGKSVEPFIIDGTTYLPVRAISEAFGKKVDWQDSTKTVLITSPADDNKVLTEVENGEYLVIKDEDLASIQDVQIKTINNIVTAEITTDKPVYKYKYFSLTEPQRLVIDIENSKFSMDTSAKKINFGLINQIRFGEQDNHVSRIVLDLIESANYTFTAAQNDTKDKTYLAMDEKFVLNTNKPTPTPVPTKAPDSSSISGDTNSSGDGEETNYSSNGTPVIDSGEKENNNDNSSQSKSNDFYVVADDLAVISSITYSSATNIKII